MGNIGFMLFISETCICMILKHYKKNQNFSCLTQIVEMQMGKLRIVDIPLFYLSVILGTLLNIYVPLIWL